MGPVSELGVRTVPGARCPARGARCRCRCRCQCRCWCLLEPREPRRGAGASAEACAGSRRRHPLEPRKLPCRFREPVPMGAPGAPMRCGCRCPVPGAVPGTRCQCGCRCPVPVPGGAPGARRGARARRGAVRYGGAERAPGTLNGRRFIYRPLHRGSRPPDGRRHRAGSGTGLRVSPATRVAGAGSPRDHRASGPQRGCGDRATGFLPGEESDTRSPQPRGFWG